MHSLVIAQGMCSYGCSYAVCVFLCFLWPLALIFTSQGDYGLGLSVKSKRLFVSKTWLITVKVTFYWIESVLEV